MPAPSTPGSPQELEDLLTKVTESESFRAAPVMRSLLLYLWAHRSEPVSEYSIAIDALGRSPAAFDSKTDSSVRVQIARLRTRLKDFYERAGRDFPLHIEIPLGQHELQWSYVPPAAAQPEERRSLGRLRYATPAAAALLLILCAVLLVQNQYLRSAAAVSSAPLSRFWQAFLANYKPVLIVVPSPLHFYWPNPGVYMRDLSVSDFVKWPTSPALRKMAEAYGPPTLSQTYVGSMEMLTGIKLLQYLETHGRDVQVLESRRYSPDFSEGQNTIFLGMPRTAVYLDRLFQKTNFYMAGVQPDIIRSRHPQPGEPAEYKETAYSADRGLYPAVIVLLPRRPDRTRALLLIGRALNGPASLLLTLEGSRALDEAWLKAGSPDAWEMVVEAEIYRDSVLKVTPRVVRVISPDFWK